MRIVSMQRFACPASLSALLHSPLPAVLLLQTSPANFRIAFTQYAAAAGYGQAMRVDRDNSAALMELDQG